jgi:hypothetical protein
MNTKIGKFDLGSSDKVAHTGAQLGVARLEATPLGYSFWLKGTPTEIRVVLSVNGEQGGFNFHTSHVIKTPKQLEPYYPNRRWGDDAGYALHLAVTSLSRNYAEAVGAGLTPAKDWLIPNTPE